MSEQLIQKLLDIGGCDADTEWAKGYDDGVNAAIDEVERYFEQPTLNENQQSYLKSAIDEIERSMRGNKDRNVNEVYLYNAIRFIKVVLEQEEE